MVLAESCPGGGAGSRKVRMTGKPGKEDQSAAEEAVVVIVPRSAAK